MQYTTLNPDDFDQIVFFTGAGMSAESGIPTYRGEGGVWKQYNWQEFACAAAFEDDPEKVLEFHHIRRDAILDCEPHGGHKVIARIEANHPHVTVVTQNIDGLHQRAGSRNVVELHGTLWRVRCDRCRMLLDDLDGQLLKSSCSCGRRYRPDIVWFGDMLNPEVVDRAVQEISGCNLFISIGTSGVVWPAAGFPQMARTAGALCLEINLETTDMSLLYHSTIHAKAGSALNALFPE